MQVKSSTMTLLSLRLHSKQRLFGQVLVKLFIDLWNSIKEICYKPKVSHLEDWCIGIFVDGHDGLGIFHTGQMLDSTRDANGNVQFLHNSNEMVIFRISELHRLLTGATILPVCPTCKSLGTNPASTAAREAPTAAFSLSASSYSILKFSPLFMPRPPEITRLALVSSGRSDLVNS